MDRLPLLVLLALTLDPSPVRAQTIPEVTVDLTSGKFADDLPFETPFRIVGEVDPSVTAVSLTYRVQTPSRYHYWPACQGSGVNRSCVSPVLSWRRGLVTTGNRFSITVGPLHANEAYVFQFSWTATIDVAGDQDAIREALFQQYRSVLTALYQPNAQNVPPQLTQNQILTELAKVEAWLKQRLARSVPGAVANQITVPSLANDAATLAFADRLLSITSTIRSGSRQVTSSQVPDLESKWQQRGPALQARLKDVFDGTIDLDTVSSRRFDEAVNPARDLGGPMTVREAASHILDGLRFGTGLKELYEGGARFQGNALTPSAGIHPPTVRAIADVLQVLTGSGFRRENNNLLFTASEAADLRADLILPLHELVNTVERVAANRVALEALETEMPATLADITMRQQFDIPAQPIVGDADGNIYVSVDAGIAFAVEHAFGYTGVNFYLVPVRRSAPLRMFQGRKDWILKRFSFLVGMTMVGFERDRVKKLFGSGVFGSPPQRPTRRRATRSATPYS